MEEVKLAIKPHYVRKTINKEDYKEILRKSVNQVWYSQTCFSDHLSTEITFYVSLENGFALKHVLKELSTKITTQTGYIDGFILKRVGWCNVKQPASLKASERMFVI